MAVVLAVQILTIVCVLLSESAVIDNNSKLNKARAAILHQLLAEECPNELKMQSKVPDHKLDKISLTYQALLKLWINCRQKTILTKSSVITSFSTTTSETTGRTKFPSTNKTPAAAESSTLPNTNIRNDKVSTTTAIDATTKTSSEVSTVQPVPEPCLSATNLTEAWRKDHDGKNIKPGGAHSQSKYACDLYKELEWFRFTGYAGK